MNIRNIPRRVDRAAVVRLFVGSALLALAGCATAPAPPVARPEAPRPSIIPPPQVMVLLNEQAPDGQAGVLSEALAVPLLLARQVTVVDPATVQANRDRMRTLLIQNGDEQGALMAGQQLGADVVISGTVETKRLAAQLAGSNLKSYLATVTLRAVCTADARLLATATDAATAIALEDATGTAKTLRLALNATLDKLVPELLKAWGALPEAVRLKRLGAAEGMTATAQTPAGDETIAPPPTGYEPPVTAIWQMTPQIGVSSNWMPMLTETLYACAQQSQWFRLVTRDDMAKLLAEHKLQLSELCDSSTRAAEFGRILNAQKMVIGTASRLGSTYQVVLKLIDVETGEVDKAGQASGGGNMDVLIRLIRQAAADMLRTAAAPVETGGAAAAL